MPQPQFVSMASMLAWMRLSYAARMSFVAPAAPAAPAGDPVLTDPGESLTQSGAAMGGTADNQSYTLASNNEVLNLFGAANDQILVRGSQDQVIFNGCYAQDVTDRGTGTRITIQGSVALTLHDLDPTGTVTIMKQMLQPTVQDDGHGGTIVAGAWGGNSIDFVGVHVPASHVTLSNFAVTITA